jgi:hypothetical protein
VTSGPGGGVLRGAVLAGLSALLAAVGHAAGGGAVPDLAVLVPILPLLAWAFTGAASRCRGLAGTVAVLAVGQFVLHNAMELLHPAHAGSAMLAMHAVATVVTALALRHADRGTAALMAALRRVLPRRLVPPPADRPLPVLAVPGPAVPAGLSRAFVVAHARRGPPVTC